MSSSAYSEFDALCRELCAEVSVPAFTCRIDAMFQPERLRRLWAVADLLIDHAKQFNLTSILEPREIVRKHILDSLIPLAMLEDGGWLPTERNARLLDVGTGAGFPLLPWGAILEDSGVRLVGMDATAKKITHVTQSAAYAGLSSVTAVQGRAEELAHGNLRATFDLVTARAVADLPVLAELCCPYVKKGGVFAALKANADDELAAASPILTELGMEEISVLPYSLPGGDARTLAVFRKVRPTPISYPRKFAEIKKGTRLP